MSGAVRSARTLTRDVLRVAVAYAAGAWALLQVASVVTRPFALPAWTMRALITAAVTGLPAVLLVTWFRGMGVATPAVTPSSVAAGTEPTPTARATPTGIPLRVGVSIAVIALLLAVLGVLVVRPNVRGFRSVVPDLVQIANQFCCIATIAA